MRAVIAICTYNRPADLKVTLNSVSNIYSDFPDMIIVDQSKDNVKGEVEEIAHRYNNVDYIHLDAPSLTKARNIALKEAKDLGYDIIIYIDDDVEIGRVFIEQHVKSHMDKNVIGVGGREILKNGVAGSKEKLNRFMRVFFLFRERLNRYSSEGYAPGLIAGKALFLGGNYNVKQPCYLDTVRGCNMSFKVDALNAIGGFDEEFKGTARREESDICMRLMEKFHKNCIVFSPDATLVHNMAVSGGCRASKDKRADYIRNEFFFLDKHVKNLLWRAIAKGLTWLKVFMLD